MREIENSALSPHAWKLLGRVKAADLLVGIPSFNNAHTINYVIHQAAQGLATHFPEMKSVIFVSDGHSTDGTLAVVNAMHLPIQTAIVPTTYIGASGKGSAVKAVFEAATFLKTEGAVLLDADLRSVTPEWIRLLTSPVLEGTGLVTPLYVRHKYDGTITNFLCYPVTASLYCKEVRQPIGGDFGLSIRLIEELLASPLWQTPYVPRFGIDIFETHTALAKGFAVKQAFLKQKIHEAKDPARHLAPMFRQVLGSMFTCISQYEDAWKRPCSFDEAEIAGERKYEGMPEPIKVDLPNIIGAYKKGFDDNKRVYRTILGKDLFEEVGRLKKAKEAELAFPSETWAKVVYSFAAGFKAREHLEEREGILDALRVLWLGKVAAFINETLEKDSLEAEGQIQEEVRAFERLKPYLLDVY